MTKGSIGYYCFAEDKKGGIWIDGVEAKPLNDPFHFVPQNGKLIMTVDLNGMLITF